MEQNYSQQEKPRKTSREISTETAKPDYTKKPQPFSRGD